ncbi:SusC/RagA family TonB-linked outer membrane protein [Pedobacter psychroterrae]|uniref:SusC/RagA family TonB-linked outer membrane protein n=1 Tax=Pedobacter psychroterrae TaxID=2530453 RepID=A0A4R0NLA0_9SPHI|nr:SusC/RagA family TonB-linked outer membrane protein [Pedobacter psychroterrae]TCD00959.1 SusC/RagA family TonB-linked outer membrane protein [Pedobacter psychroterrae]
MKFTAIPIAMPLAWPNVNQTLKIMKLTTLFIIIGFLQASATTVYSQVTLNEKHTPFEKVLEKIEKQTKYVFIYDETRLQLADIDVNVQNVSVQKALDACFKDLPVTYDIVGENIILKPAEPTFFERLKKAFEDPIQIKGIVTDSTGMPLSRATVFFIKKKNPVAVAPVNADGVAYAVGEISYVTSDNGLFFIDAEEGDEMGVSYVGYETYKFKVKKNMPFLNIILHSSTSELKEIVVQTGYQTLSKERATGSFSKPDMKKFAQRSGTMDVIGRLDGLIPGLTVSQDITMSSITRSSSRRALIRGSSSISLPTEPLYVVNGVIVSDFSSINIDDIEDITVLKDAAAAAIWGAQAANGVVVVVTKNGGKNQKIKVNYQGFVDFQGKPDLNYQRFLTSAQYIQAAKETFDPNAFPYNSLYYGTVAPHDQILYDENRNVITAAQANKSLDSLAGINNKQQILDLWYRNALTTNHSVSASGGSRYYSFFSSMGYTNSQSNTIGQTNNTYRLSLNQTFNPGDRFSFSLNTNLANNVSSNKNAITIGADAIPYQLFKDANGNNINMPYIYGYSPGLRVDYQQQSGIDLETYSPLDEINYAHSNNNNLSLNLVANTTLKLVKGLSYQGTYGYLRSPGESTNYDDHKTYSQRKQLVSLTMPGTGGSDPTYLIPATGGQFLSSNFVERSWTLRNQLVYSLSLRDGNDQLDLQGGQEARENFQRSRSTAVVGYDENLLTYSLLDYYSLSQGVPGTVTGYGYYSYPPYQTQEELNRFNSYFGLASYTLNHKYSVDASWRVDHSNLFGSDVSAQNKPVYSFGGKWNVGNEDFFKPVTWVNNLALRVTYGITGNSPLVGAASSFDVLYDPTSSYSPNLAGRSYVISSYANRKLSWEATHTTNIGVDFGLLGNRLSGTVEYYHKNTTDLIGRVNVDPFTGASSTTSNVGNLTNNGLNIGLNSINVSAGNFTWSTAVAFALNNNKLVSYSDPQPYMNSINYITYANYVLGYSVMPLFAFQYAGLDAMGDPQIKLADGTITKDPQKPTGDDLVYKGSIIPKFNGGFSNSFKYKSLELTGNMVYSFGAVMRRDVNQFYGGDRLTSSPQSFSGNVSEDFANRWKKAGDENITNIPRYVSDGYTNYSQRNTNYYTMADINVVSASYVKLRDVSLAYSLPENVTNLLKIESASLRFQVNNILLWKANKYGIDPEFQNFSYGYRNTRSGQHATTIALNVNF